jgi:hypothetical protein
MKRFLLFFSFVFVFSYISLPAQSIRKVLIEEATNASCGPCASQNPSFQQWILRHIDRVIPVVYHAWWPGAKDPMYLYDTIMNQTRIKYYGISGVPSGRVAGKIAPPTGSWYPGAVGDIDALSVELSRQLFYSPITITLTMQHNNGAGTVHVDVSSIAKFSDKKLRIVICEEAHHYDNAGNNGEKEFPFLARRMLPDANGTSISLDAGESKSFDFDFAVDPSCADDLYAVAFIQDDITQEVLQAEWTIQQSKPKEPDYAVIPMFLDLFQLRNTGDAFSFDVQALNNSDDEAVFTLAFNLSNSAPQDWNVEIEGNQPQVTVLPHSKKTIKVKVTIGATAGIADVLLSVQVQGQSNSLWAQSISVVHQGVERLHILGGESAHSVLPIIDTETSIGKFYNLSSNAFANILPQLNSLKTIVWNGSTTGEVTASVANSLLDAIYNHINVVICGGKIAYGLYSNNVLPLLGVQFIGYCREGYGQAPWPVTLAGVPGDPISGDFGNKVQGYLIQYLLPLYRIINPMTTTPVMTFAKSKDSIFAVKVQFPESRAVLLSLNPYIIADVNIRTKLVTRSIAWVENVSDVEDILQPADFVDISVAPNPTSDDISIALNCRTNIAKSKIYLANVIGEPIGIVYEGELIAGETTFDYSLSGLANQVLYLVAELDGSVKVHPIQKIK